jgi:hypothetical protein
MRAGLTVPCLAVVLVLASCGWGIDEELRSLVEDLAPKGGEAVACEWESSSGNVEPDSYYECIYLSRLRLEPLARAIYTRLENDGFLVGCRINSRRIVLTGSRGRELVRADLSTDTYEVSGDDMFAPREETDVPEGQVAVSIRAERHDEAPSRPSSGACVFPSAGS